VGKYCHPSKLHVSMGLAVALRTSFMGMGFWQILGVGVVGLRLLAYFICLFSCLIL